MDENKPPENLTKSDTMSMISHELRTSLTASKWMLEMLQDGDAGELSHTQKEIISKLALSNARMMEVATNLISLSKTESHESEYHMSELDIVDIIASVVFELGSEAFSKHIEIVYTKPEQEVPKIKGDESKLRIVYQNIIDNAIKYSKSGDKIMISINKEDNYIKTTIKDTGIGIDPRNMPWITSQFYRAPNAIEKVSGGSGIGLYICKRIIEGHNGTLNIDSALKEGTVVKITLPIFK